MIGKVGAVIVVVIMVSLAYLILLVVIPILNTFALSANATMVATSNMSNYPGTGEFIVAIPWICFFVPACIGIGLVVVILRGEIWHQ